MKYSEKHALQECDKLDVYGKPSPSGLWEIHRAKRLAKEEGWRDWFTCYIAMYLEELPEDLVKAKAVLQSGNQINNQNIYLTTSPERVDWAQINEYFTMRLKEGAL